MVEIFSAGYTGNGGTQAITGVGFQPDALLIKKEGFGSGAEGVFVTKDMTAGDAKEVNNLAIPATGIVTSLDADGFTLPNHVSTNASSAEYSYTAWKAHASDCVVSTYSGDGGATQAITGVGFQGNFMIIAPEAAQEMNWKVDSVATAAQTQDFTTNQDTGRVNSFDADGFTVDTHDSVNATSTTYYYLIIKESAGFVDISGYSTSGSPVDDRDITGVGFQPDSIMLMRDGDFNSAIWWNVGLGGDATMGFTASGAIANRIQAVASDGFQVGTSGDVQINGIAHIFAAFINGDSQAAGADQEPALVGGKLVNNSLLTRHLVH